MATLALLVSAVTGLLLILLLTKNTEAAVSCGPNSSLSNCTTCNELCSGRVRPCAEVCSDQYVACKCDLGYYQVSQSNVTCVSESECPS
ncbi:serine protease inhibitor 2-like [Neodiprion lecontei]|uniref:Serine protease inhibitor 2-like n=1 Tax=Neodiprion lecontei TaxID=441921 RepID=A0A6J0BQU4_NEOLC|nr:serine protease inhibitor 2-like [Neodiprion lecontei]